MPPVEPATSGLPAQSSLRTVTQITVASVAVNDGFLSLTTPIAGGSHDVPPVEPATSGPPAQASSRLRIVFRV